MASTAAVHGAARAQSYAASKGAMVAMIRALAVEMARYGVTANSILPGWIETEMTARGIRRREIRRRGAAADPGAALGRRQGLRRHRRLSRERCQQLSHGRQLRHRRGVYDLSRPLSSPSASSSSQPPM
jgi:NAD(P)-dependent dehydrogenase (short-subunit alcohol dehydrogenase family)